MIFRILLSVLLFTSQVSFGQEKDSLFTKVIETLESKKARLLLNQADKYLNTNTELSNKYLEESKQYITRNNYELKAFYQFLLSNIDRMQGNYAKAQQEALTSLDFYDRLQDTSGIIKSLRSLGVTNRFRNKHKISITYYNQALRLSAIQKDSTNLTILNNLIGIAYNRLTQLDSAEVYFKKSVKIAEAINNKELTLLLKNNLAIFYVYQDKLNDYQPILQEYLEFNKLRNAKMPTAISYHNIGFFLYKVKDYTKALVYLDSAMQLSKKEGFKFRYAKALELKSNVHEALGNYKQAFDFSKQFNVLNDSIFNLESEKKLKEYELNKAFEVERKEYELKAEIQQTKFYLYLFLGFILLISALFILYLFRKNYNTKIEVIDAELEKEKLKKELLDEKVKVSERELKWLIADNQMRLSYLQEFYNQLKLDDDITDLKDFKLFLKNLRLKLSQQINTQEKLSGLQNKINDVNKGFEAALIKDYPELTKSEREVCFLLRINLSIKEMAAIRNSSIDSIKSIRYRLRKKFDLSKDVELESFIKLL